ncbi:PIN domain-containing protein [Spirosoma arcticum]
MEADRVNYVLDANVVMAILISGKAYHREVLSNTNCCSIDFVYDEIKKYEAVIRAKAKLSERDLQRFVFDIFGMITVVSYKPLHTGVRRKGFRNILLFDEFLDSI